MAQSFTTDPAFPVADQSMTLTVDVTGVTSLEDETEVWLWAFLPNCSSDCDAITNINPATSEADAVKFSPTGNANEYSLTFTPTDIFDKSASEIDRIGFVVKAESFSDGQTGDLFFDLSDGSLQLNLTQPTGAYTFVDPVGTINIIASTSSSATIAVAVNGSEVFSTTGTSINYNYSVSESGTNNVTVSASVGGNTVSEEFLFIVREATTSEALPAGIIKGLNYDADVTKATLVLEAPFKSSAYVIGEFNDWIPTSSYQMKQDGDLFWLELSGLTPGVEYAFQYLVDESLVVSDPYTDKILDPNNDPYIPESTYPSLKSYPDGAQGIVSVLQTNQPPYSWEVTDFNKPAQEELVIYELLIRDFDEGQNYQSIIDRLDYLQTLGVNAIELMPIMEFSGNLSWGYNPSYFFAPDKYYGTKNDLKGFIDECHSRGIAVILDIVLNHTHEANPLAQLYWNESNFTPAADNPWLNTVPRHPFNVFYDFNHESTYTQAFIDSVNHYWLEEYKFDGYRFDLTKGFTQDFTEGSDVGAWSAYNQTRIDLLLRMADEIRVDHPDAYIIFEHLADNSEEKVLADNGIMLWGNLNHNFNQLTMGYADNSSIDWAYYGTRNWNDPNLVAYMESHDEERLVYRNLEFGNDANGGHNTTNLDIALERVKAASALYYNIPGPKMIWQFGELGYDQSIELNGRTGEKPLPWASADDGLEYNTDENRLRLYKVTAALAKLKTDYDLFNTTGFELDQSQSLVKQVMLRNSPYTSDPADASEMNAVIVGNFNVNSTTITINFPHDEVWYDYFSNGESINVTGGTSAIEFGPGEFRIYTDVALQEVDEELTNYNPPVAPTNLSVEEVAQQGVLLTWLDNSGIETSYRIWRATDGGAFEQIESIGPNQQEFLDATAEVGVTYTYYVEAKNKHYSSASNEEIITTTELITSLIGDVSDEVKMYPNPTTGKIYFENAKGNLEITISTVAGKEIATYQTSEGITELNLSHFQKGMYLIKFNIGSKQINRRLIIN